MVELGYVLNVERTWIWRMEKRGVFNRVNTGPFPSYLWRAVKAGIIGYHGASWRGRLAAAEERIPEVLAGRVVRRETSKKRKEKSKRKGKK